MESTDGKIGLPSRFVLTNNPDSGEWGLPSGVTYTAEPEFNDPLDPAHKRLFDRNFPVEDATRVAGINASSQTIILDLQATFHVAEVALLFSKPQKPASVTLSVATGPYGPWRAVRTVIQGEQTDAWWRLRTKEVIAQSGVQFVKLDFQADKSAAWRLSELKVYGAPFNQGGATRREAGQLVVAESGRPYAAIVLADHVYPSSLRAALLFQALAHKMNGVWLPIVPESHFDGGTTPILIGDSALARKYGVKVEQTPLGDDRYAIRGGGRERDFIALVGNDMQYGDPKDGFGQFYRGSIYAVYDFYERLGCGWFGPDDLWQVFPKVNRLSTSALAVQEVPAYKWRRIWMTGLPPESPLREAWRQGGTLIAAYHNYYKLVPPEKYKAEHPEWYGEYQPDITHPEVIRIATETLSKELEAHPDIPHMSFPVSANDNGGFKDKPYKAVGNIAAQQLYFANEIAKGLRARHPKRSFTLGILGYWYSHSGPTPMLKAEPEVAVMVVNEGNHAKPVEWPESEEIARTTGRNNTRELNALATWKQTGQLQAIYEWWIPALSNKAWAETPWYDGDTAVANLRFWYRNGIRYIDYESQGEVNSGFPIRWAQYYVGARAAWNPNLNAHDILLSACQKLFGPAAQTMAEFYGLQEKAMRDTNVHVGNWALPLPHMVYSVELEDHGDALLKTALGQTTDERQRERIQIEITQWKRMRELNATARAEKQQIYAVKLDDKTMNWSKQTINAATVVDLFDLPPNTPIEVLEKDGQNRTALPSETYDLDSGVTFRTLKPGPKN